MKCTVCTKSIESHEAGRETDRCVAEKLGYKFHQPIPGHWICGSDEAAIAPDGGGIFCVPCQGIPSYSEDIQDAWGLVEKMNNIDMSISHLGIRIWFGENLGEQAEAPTAPLAISRAFLAERG
jgi:hypothetical protein